MQRSDHWVMWCGGKSRMLLSSVPMKPSCEGTETMSLPSGRKHRRHSWRKRPTGGDMLQDLECHDRVVRIGIRGEMIGQRLSTNIEAGVHGLFTADKFSSSPT